MQTKQKAKKKDKKKHISKACKAQKPCCTHNVSFFARWTIDHS